MSQFAVPDITLCQSNDGDGCGGVFMNKKSDGLCAKCLKLAKLPNGSIEAQAWKEYKQCKSCGVAWKNFDGGICGSCQRITGTLQDAGDRTGDLEVLAQNAVDVARVARASAVDARLHKNTMHIHSTTSLDLAKSNTSAAAAEKGLIMVTVACRVKTGNKKQIGIDANSGFWGRAWEKTDYISEVLDDALKTINAQWEKSEGMGLIKDEVEFRWTGNKVLQHNTTGLTVADFYKAHTTGPNSRFYLSSEKSRNSLKISSEKVKKAESATMALELIIDKPAFLERKEEVQGPVNISSMPRKRRGTVSVFNDHSSISRSSRGFLQSSFIRTPRTVSREQTTTTDINLTKARVVCDSRTGDVDISWPADIVSFSATLGDSVFASGQTKNVYKLVINDELFVAKRFYDIGSGPNHVSAIENEGYLTDEVIRLKNITWLFAQFRLHTKKNSIDITDEIIVTECFLVREIGPPSPASGFSHDSAEGVVWLVEPRRTKSVTKFSGTLQHPSRGDKLGITLSAFAHFVYEASKKKLVIADIQGSPMTIDGVDTTVLFDIMTHSAEKDSGIGDFGLEGIHSFCTQHECNYMCHGAGFISFEEDGASESESNSTEN